MAIQIQEITVTAARTFNHPHEQYSNLRPEVTIRATLGPDDDATAAVKAMQAQAEGLVEDHKRNMLQSINELYEMSQEQAELKGLQKQLTGAQARIDEIRAKHPQLIA